MRGAVPIFRVAGIPVRIHWTFLLILPFLAWIFAREHAVAPAPLTWDAWLWGLLLALGLFASVLGHELAHSLYALNVGVRVRGITLLLIGGVSEMAETPAQPRQEAWMAIVGPLFSLALGGVLVALGGATGGADLGPALGTLGQVNLALGIFNLLPAFPMDGGRVLRALLASRLGGVRATRIAARIGQVFAVLFAIVGLLTMSFLLVFIGFFVWMGAESEGATVALREVLGRVRVRELAGPAIEPIDAADRLDVAAARMIRERRLAFPVIERGEIVGVLPLDAIESIPPARRGLTLVRQVAVRTPDVRPDDDVWTALQAMAAANLAEIPVEEHGVLVGVISRDDVARGVRLRELESTWWPGAGWRRREVEV